MPKIVIMRWMPVFLALVACAAPVRAATTECKEHDVTWKSSEEKKCAGVWRYLKPCPVPDNVPGGPICKSRDDDKKECVEYSSCGGPWGYSRESENWTDELATVQCRAKRWCPDRPAEPTDPIEPCFWYCDCDDPPDNLNAECQEDANKHLVELRQQWGDDAKGFAIEHRVAKTACNPEGTYDEKRERYACATKVSYDRLIYKAEPPCDCSVWECAQQNEAFCYTDRGKEPVFEFNPTSPGGTDGITDYQCTTGEDKAAANDTDKQEKFSFLVNELEHGPLPSDPDERATQRQTLIKQLKLVFEFYGDKLTDEQKDRARQLYLEHPELVAQCGVDADLGIEDRCLSKGEPNDLNSRMAMCHRLLSSHVPKGVREQDDLACLDIVRDAAGLPLDLVIPLPNGIVIPIATCRDAYVRSSALLADRLLDARLDTLKEELAASSGEGDIAAAKKALHFLDTWYQHRAVSDVGPTLDQALVAKLQGFWKRVEQGKDLRRGFEDAAARCKGQEYPSLDSCPSDAQEEVITKVKEALDATVSDGMAIDQAILEAAFSSTTDNQPVLRGVPLLAVTGDILTALANRMESQLPMHDVGCLFKGCKYDPDQPPQVTPLAQTWALLASLDDGAALKDALNVDVVPPSSWKASFQAISGAHGRLADALNAVVPGAYQPGTVMDIGVGDVPASTWKLFQTIRAGRTHSQAYQATGLFTMASGRRLLWDTNWEKRNLIKDQYLPGKVAQLDAEKGQFDAQLAQIVHDMVNVSTNEKSRANLELRRDHLLDEIEQLEEKRDAHVAAHRAGDVFADIVRTFTDMQGYFDNIQRFSVVGEETPRHLSAKDAKYSLGRRNLISDVTGESPITLSRGQILAVTTTGQWAPSCALRWRLVLTPNGNAAVSVNTAGVTTGPEGYNITWNGSTYDSFSASYSTTDSADLGVKGEVCYGTPAVAYAWGFSAQVCAYAGYNHNWSWTDQDQKGRDSRTSASFSSGIYLPGFTPFAAPAGGLLIVEMPKGETSLSERIDVHLVRAPYTSIPVRADADLYPVVNDLGLCDDADESHKLEIRMQTLQGQEEVAKQLLGRIAAVMNKVRAKELELVKRGEILPAEVTQIEGEARVTALSDMPVSDGAVPIPVSEYPPPLRDLFEAYLAGELARLQRAVRLANIEEEREQLLHEISTIQSDLAYSEREGALLSAWPAWSVRNLDIEHLSRESRRLADVLRDFVYPLLDLWYPELLADLADNEYVVNPADTLVRQQPGAKLVELTADVVALADAVANAIPVEDIEDSNVNLDVQYVAISFRRPDCPGPDDLVDDPKFIDCPQNDDGSYASYYGGASTYGTDGYSLGIDPRYTLFRTADPARAKALWQAIENRQIGEIRILPQDIYEEAGGNAVLSCRRKIPVLRHMGIAIVRPWGQPAGASHPQSSISDRDTELLDVFGDAGAEQPFASVNGLIGYEMENDKWRDVEIPLVYAFTTNPIGLLEHALFGMGSVPLQQTMGLSPFGRFRLKFQSDAVWPGDLDEDEWGPAASELVVFLQIESRSAGAPLSWVPGCP